MVMKAAVLLCLGIRLGRCDEQQLDSICAGQEFTCGRLVAGDVKCWGLNSKGQLGYGDKASRGGNAGDMVKLPSVDLGGKSATQVICGDAHACALLEGGVVKCWGSGEFGVLGYGSTESFGDDPDEMGAKLPAVNLGTDQKAKAISALTGHTCAVLEGNGQVKCWGANAWGVLGFESASESVGDEADEMGDFLPAVDLGTGLSALEVSAGMSSTCALLSSKDMKCWGRNETTGYAGSVDTEPGVGLGDALPLVDLGTENTASKVSVGSDHTCVILSSGNLKCWGFNGEGQVGLATGTAGDAVVGDDPGEMGDDLDIVDVGSADSVVDAAAGNGRSFAVLKDGSVKAWGSGASGGLGYGDAMDRGVEAGQMGVNLPAVELGSGRTAVRTSSSSWNHVCVILSDGAAKCWGENAHGQLGYNDLVSRGAAPSSMGDNLPTLQFLAAATITATTTATSTTIGSGTVLAVMGLYLLVIILVVGAMLGVGMWFRSGRSEEAEEEADMWDPLDEPAVKQGAAELLPGEATVATGGDVELASHNS